MEIVYAVTVPNCHKNTITIIENSKYLVFFISVNSK